MFSPPLSPDQPRYLAIADAIAQAIQIGQLGGGDRLPPQRELADELGVTVGTVSRGYAEAERRGLVFAEIGRGTFVRKPGQSELWPEEKGDPDVIDLGLNLPVRLPDEGGLYAEALRGVANESNMAELLTYHPESGTASQLSCAVEWLRRLGFGDAEQNNALITAGSQHGLNVVFSALFGKGAVVLAEELTYPPLKTIAKTFGVRLRPVAMDREGICPEALEEACARGPLPVGLYTTPTIQNPTTATQSLKRRQSIAEIAERYELLIVEDDIHGLLPPEPITPIAGIAPERVIYLTSLSKGLAPGLRIGFFFAPSEFRPRLLAAIHSTMWMAPPLTVEVACRWISDGTAERLLAAKRLEINSRQQMVRKILSGQQIRTDPFGYSVWLELPDPWNADELVATMQQRGVIVLGAGAFALNRSRVPQAVRLSIGNSSRSALESALTTLSAVLEEGSAHFY